MRNLPLTKLPSETDTVIYLIREELKARKLFNTLRDIGFSDSYLQPNLDSIIIRLTGLYDGTDESHYFLSDLLDKYSDHVEDPESIMEQALNVYHELVAEKKRRNDGVEA